LKKISITFDYEIYFKENFLSYDEILFDPTEKLLSLAKKYDAKFIFYIDIMCLMAFEREHADNSFVKRFKKQIRDISEAGMVIGFHFHPHWHDSKFSDDTWLHDYKNWDYSKLIESLGHEKAFSILKESYDYLEELSVSSIKIHRAGGLSLYNNQSVYLNDLKKCGVNIDSSILPGRRYLSKQQNYDYLNYSSDDIEKLENGMSELLIASVPKSIISSFYQVINKLVVKLHGKSALRGRGATSQCMEYKSKIYTVSFDRLNHSSLFLINHLTKTFLKNNEVMTILAHPKALTRESFRALEKYIKSNKKSYCFSSKDLL